ncbi:hypothetical protein X801_02086 [Opisthorchis viverrini]|uniref:V-type proton ATPase subunit C n=1 Tax=Opisthorchis viverrini TaxID=6198 RepID=A0A1S8X5L1_OPIVI|nr:hypothetical protein X801_02086 [Opisthorchis viverrini]
MSEFWIISLPGERNPDEVFERLNAALSKYPGLSSQWKFSIPTDLKVGTLDVLVGLSDELAKLDIYAERDFEYDEKKIEEGKTELSKLESDKKRQFVSRAHL